MDSSKRILGGHKLGKGRNASEGARQKLGKVGMGTECMSNKLRYIDRVKRVV